MVRGANSEFRFNLPYDFSSVTSLNIVFWQEGNDSSTLPIVKHREDCYAGVTPKQIVVFLNSEETLRFSDRRKARVQLIGAAGAVPIASPIQLIPVYPIYDGVIPDDDILPPPSADGWIILDGEPVKTN